MADDHPPSAPEATLQEPTLPISTGLPSSLAPTYPESSPPAGSETATPVVGQLLPRVNTTTRFTPTATSSTTTPIPPSPQRRLSGLISSSPLSSSSSARRRQSSLSSTISNTTEATSLDLDSGSEDCMSSEGADNVASGLGSGSGTTVGSNLPSSSSSSSLSFAQVQQHQQQQGGAASGNNNASLTSKRIPYVPASRVFTINHQRTVFCSLSSLSLQYERQRRQRRRQLDFNSGHFHPTFLGLTHLNQYSRTSRQ